MPQACRLCDVTLADAATWRQHLKTDAHVSKLQHKVADTTKSDFPPTISHPETQCRATHDKSPSPRRGKCQSMNQTADSDGSSSEDSDNWEPPEFFSEKCLYCDTFSPSFQESLVHMKQVHSFVVPNADSLIVEQETLIWYLNMLVRGYQECTFCFKGHSTVASTQHHMRDTGHCRIQLGSELADFYNTSKTEDAMPTSQIENGRVRVDPVSLRLPSGKILGHRAHHSGPRELRVFNHRNKHPPTIQPLPRTRNVDRRDLVAENDPEVSALASNLGHFSSADQLWLSRLPSNEVRSLVLATWRDNLKATRASTRVMDRFAGSRGRTLMKHFRPSVPTRLSRWG